MADFIIVITGSMSITAFVFLGIDHLYAGKGLSPGMTFVVALMLATDVGVRMIEPAARLIDALVAK